MDIPLRTRYLLKISAADTLGFLSRLTAEGITVENVRLEGSLKMFISVKRKDVQTVKRIGERMGVQVNILGIRGVYTIVNIFRTRYIMTFGILLLIFLTIYIPTRILFVSIEGNEYIEDGYLLEQAEKIGICFGASRGEVRSERMKNALLQAVPELKWAGINTYGCCAEIYVIERKISNISTNDSPQFQGVYAIRDSIVSSITVTSGTPLCKPGQGVKEGQLLISGYTDCGLVMRADSAEGVVRGVTKHKINAVFPLSELKKELTGQNNRSWSIRIGKKQIKLHIDSGNYDRECGKIYETYPLTLPGGFYLPLSMVKESVLDYETDLQTADDVTELIVKLADRYIVDQMIDGDIIHSETSVTVQQDAILFTGVYTCEESIGKLKNEEIG